LRLAEEKSGESYTVYNEARWIYGECKEIGWTIPLKRGLTKPAIHKKYGSGAFHLRLTRGGAPHIFRRRRRPFSGGGVGIRRLWAVM